jgi:hypothetical protein
MHNHPLKPFPLLFLLLLPGVSSAPAQSAPELVQVRKIWDAAPHNAFTDLLRFKGEWFCSFREGKGHVSPDGALRVLISSDGQTWNSAALLTSEKADLRDPKLTLTPDGRMMLTAAAAWHQPAPARHQTHAWFSDNGRQWSEPIPIGETNMWLWRVIWHKDRAYGIGYETTGEKFARLYSSVDGRRFDTRVESLFTVGYPNESSLIFEADDSVLCLLRRDGSPNAAMLGRSRPPYTDWSWHDLGVRIGGPQMIRLPDGRFVAGVRLYDREVRTSLAWLDPEAGKLTEFLKLPSGGDSSYPGLVWHDDQLWVSYYSSHEGRSSIYLAQVKLPQNR